MLSGQLILLVRNPWSPLGCKWCVKIKTLALLSTHTTFALLLSTSDRYELLPHYHQVPGLIDVDLHSRSPGKSPTALKSRQRRNVERKKPTLPMFLSSDPSMGRTVKPQSCNIIRLHVQFSYEVSEIKAIHHRLGAEWGKPGPAQPYL